MRPWRGTVVVAGYVAEHDGVVVAYTAAVEVDDDALVVIVDVERDEAVGVAAELVD